MKNFYLLLLLIFFPEYLIYAQENGAPLSEPALEDIVTYQLNELKDNPQNLKAAIILMESYYLLTDYRKTILYANVAEDIFLNRNQNSIVQPDKEKSGALFYIIQTRGKSRHKIADYRKAKLDYMEALEINDTDSDLLVDIGNLYYNMEQYDSALYYFKKADSESGEGFKSKFNMANTYYVLKEYDSALLYYDKSIHIKEDFPYAYFYKGTIYNELELFPEAINAFNKAIRIWPDKSEIYFRRGYALQSLGKYEEALLDWNTVIMLDSQNFNAIRNRAIAYMELNKKKSALKDLNFLISDNPAEVEAYFLRGRLFYKKKKLKKAFNDLRIADNKGLINGELYYMIGDLYRKEKDLSSACDYLKKASKLDFPMSGKNKKFFLKCNGL
jgi:tetratricopeptide (TPR) repeat protein